MRFTEIELQADIIEDHSVIRVTYARIKGLDRLVGIDAERGMPELTAAERNAVIHWLDANEETVAEMIYERRVEEAA
jgi:N-acyl-L-homoserine lactone synthetase